MELHKVLDEALKESFKADAILAAIKKKIEQTIERRTFEKYKDKNLFNNGMDFELIGVKANFNTYHSEFKQYNIGLELAYFCKSKLPKEKREKLEKVKADYKDKGWMHWNNYKVPAWKELCYDIELEVALYGNVDLCIE